MAVIEENNGAIVVKVKERGPQGTFNPNAPVPAVQFDLASGVTVAQGQLAWNADEETLDLGQNGAVLQLGQEIHYHARNNTLSSIPNGTPVMATGTIGNSGRITLSPMDGTDPANAKYFLGLSTESIAVDDDGKVSHFGKVRGIDTTGGMSFGGLETWIDGDVLYVDPNNIGYLTNVAPVAPAMSLAVAIVIHAHASGTLFVRATNLDENALGGSGGGIGYGATLPTAPTTGDLFIHVLASTHTILKQWNGSYWYSVLTIGGVLNFYVDYTNGTDDDNHGFAAGTDAYKTMAFATSRLPETSNAAIKIILSNESHPSGAITINKASLDITIEGTIVEVLGTTTPTGVAAGSITVAGAGWTVNEFTGRFLNQGGTRYYIISNTADTIYVRENLTLPLVDFTIDHTPSVSGPITLTARRGSVKNIRAYVNSFGFICNIYTDEWAEIHTCFFKSAGTFVNRAAYVQTNGYGSIQSSNFETALLTDSPLWLQGPGQFNVNNVRSWKAVLSDNGAILFRGCQLNIYHTYMFRGGLQGLWGAQLYNSNTVPNSIMVRLANIGLYMDVSCGRPEYGDIVFDSCTVDTQLDMLQLATEVPVDASGFAGNLSGTDTDVQTALETLDALVTGGIGTGDTLPLTPDTNDLFIHSPTGRNVLMRYDGVEWVPVELLDNATIYIDPLGTNDPNYGHGVGADAYATFDYAMSQIPPEGHRFQVLAYLSDDTHTLGSTALGFTDSYTLRVYGTKTVLHDNLVSTDAGLGYVTVAGAGWTPNEFADKVYIKDKTINPYRILSNTTDTLTLESGNVVHTAGTFDIESYSIINGSMSFRGSSFFMENIIAKASTTGYVLQARFSELLNISRCFFDQSLSTGKLLFLRCIGGSINLSSLSATIVGNNNTTPSFMYAEAINFTRALFFKENPATAALTYFEGRVASGSFSYWNNGGIEIGPGTYLDGNTLYNNDVEDAIVGVKLLDGSLGFDSTNWVFTNCTTDVSDLRENIKATNQIVDASGFTGNLSGTDTDVQTALETVDALPSGVGSGSVFPSTPSAGQLFTLTVTGRSVLYQYTGTAWIPLNSVGDVTMYVDGASGTDTPAGGTATGASAFATIQYAIDHVPAVFNGDVNIYIAAGTYDEQIEVRGKTPGGNYTFTIHGTMTDLETAASATCTLGVGGNHGTVTKAGQFTGDDHSKKLAWFATDEQYRAILSNTNDTLQCVGQIPSATTQDVVVRDWGTILDFSSAGFPVRVDTVPVTFRELEIRGQDRTYCEANAFVNFQACYFEHGAVYQKGSGGTIRECVSVSDRSYPFDILNLSSLSFFYNYSESLTGRDGMRTIQNSVATVRGSYLKGPNDRVGFSAQEGSMVSFWSTDAGYGDTIVDDWGTGIYSYSGSGVANTATFCQFISCLVNTNADASKFAYID